MYGAVRYYMAALLYHMVSIPRKKKKKKYSYSIIQRLLLCHVQIVVVTDPKSLRDKIK